MREGVFYSRDMEAAVLGICMLEATAFGRTQGLIDAKCFYFEDNARIYEELERMYSQDVPIDILTVWQRMAESGAPMHCMMNAQKPSAALAHYIAALTNFVVSSAHIEYHCKVLKKMWRKRELEKITNQGFDPQEDEKRQAYHLNEQISNILSGEAKQEWYTMDQLIFNLLVHQRDMQAGNIKLITTGFRTINRENGGFSGGQMIVLGARPSVGKSALMGKMALAMAKEGNKVGIISLEMNNNEVAGRLSSLDTDMDFNKVYRALWQDQREAERFYNIVAQQTAHYPLFVSDKTKVSINEIKAKAAKLRHQHGLDCLMIDYLQLVDGTGENKNYNREQEVARISRGLKMMAMEMNIPVIVLCQLNRAVTNRGPKDRYPRISDLRESGAIEQDADVVMMLHRDFRSGYEVDPDTGNSTEFEADLLGLKWRNGAPFHLKLEFDPPKMKFKEQPNLIPYNPPTEEVDADEPF
jgi:replicative DNA helicase